MLTVKEEFLTHAKTKRAIKQGGSEVIVLWLALKTYSAVNLTDGFIPDEDIDDLPGAPRHPKRGLEALLSCGQQMADGTRKKGLVERVEHGWQLHDYLDHEESAADVRARRAAKAARQKRWRNNRNVDGVDAGNTPDVDTTELSTSSTAPSNVDSVDAPGDVSRVRTRAGARAPVPPPDPDPDPTPEEKDTGQAKEPDQAERVFRHWQQEHDHPRATFQAHARKIRARLRSYTAEQLCFAITAAKLDPWLMGEDPKSPRKYDGLETLLRSDAKVEELIELGERGRRKAPARASSRSEAQLDAQVQRAMDLSGGDPWNLGGSGGQLP